jgi:tRNA G26 N,N-dimethylase Trm1
MFHKTDGLSKGDYDLVNTSVSGATFEQQKCSKCGEEGLHVCIPIVAQKLLDDKEFVKKMANKKEVKKLLNGPVAICNECVTLCNETLAGFNNETVTL